MYQEDFYKTRDSLTRRSAELIGGFLLDTLPKVDSAVDFGCGVGTWLAVFKRLGVERVRGLDGDWVNPALLEISAGEFNPSRLDQPIKLAERFDLAISLEVAEHLAPEAAEVFVSSLTAAAPVVLFSAAIPGQGGRHHVNERWQSYWSGLFAQRGYRAFDVIRSRFWAQPEVLYWYRQNVVLYIQEDRSLEIAAVEAKCGPCESNVADLVHPELFEILWAREGSLEHSWKQLKKNLKRCVRGQWGRSRRCN